jgi:hypothetical protein
VLIRAYASYWNPDVVDWGTRGPGNGGHLLGTLRLNGQKKTVDFWDGKGVYVLHDEFKAIYVGQAFARTLGPRLRDHLTDRFAGRWDMFSWFSISSVTKGGFIRDPGQRQVSPAVVNDTLEALAILVADPALNRKRESIPSCLEVDQAKNPHPKTVRHYLESILDALHDKSGG